MAKSIMQTEKVCYICGSPYVEEHHIFGASNRKWSEKYGLKVWLCHSHHNEPPYGVHFNSSNRLKLQREAQAKYNEVYGDGFVDIFGKNYL